jgi:DNA-binding PadR family transcriptional regulator
MSAEPTLLAGTLDLLILRTLAWGPRHGYAVARWIKETSDEAIEVEDRALYLSLHRPEANRRAKFYQLTRAGRQKLRSNEDSFTRYVEGVFKILRARDASLAERRA